MKGLIAILLFVLSGCSAALFDQSTTEQNLHRAFPNGVMYFDPMNPQYIYIFDTVSHMAFQAVSTPQHVGVDVITMLEYLPNTNK